MIPGFEHRWQIEAQLAAFKHERKGAQNVRHQEAIEEQEKIYRAELERMEREGDYVEPKPPARQGRFAWVDDQGSPRVR